MSKANEFQIYAGECLSWAKSANTEEKRHQFLDLARIWMQAATKADHDAAGLSRSEGRQGDK
jgi:hypothetical protein